MFHSLLNTAEYCFDTSKQLEEKLLEKVDQKMADKVSLEEEKDAFADAISNATQLLSRSLETDCIAALLNCRA